MQNNMTIKKNFHDKNCSSISTLNKSFKILKLNWITFCDRGRLHILEILKLKGFLEIVKQKICGMGKFKR